MADMALTATTDTPSSQQFSTFADVQEDVIELASSQNLFGKIYYPLVVFIGITGNTLNLIILSKRTMSTYSSTVYLIGLACADILVLSFQTTLKYVVYKSWQVSGPRGFAIFLCVYNNWILISAVRTSFFITVGFTIERYIAIAHPLWGKTWCTVSRAKKSLLVIYFCGFAYGTYNLFVRYVDDNGQCKFKNKELSTAMSTLNAACFLTTYILVMLFNGLMIVEFTKQTRQLKSHLTTGNSQSSKEGSVNPSNKGRRFSSQVHVTITLLTVSAMFMLLWFPWLIVYMNRNLPNNTQGLPDHTLQQCAEIMGPLNSAVNFFLYNVTSRRFRREFLHLMYYMVRCHKKSSGSSESSANNSYQISAITVGVKNTSFLSSNSLQVEGSYRQAL